jgi:hypothetical protein
MKILVTIPLLVLLFGSCKKSNDCGLVKGKVVHRSCASIVVQVLDPANYNLGQQQWQQTDNSPVYEHVFSVKNICSFPGNTAEGEEINFRVISNDASNIDCVRCRLWDNPPAKQQEIKVIK